MDANSMKIADFHREAVKNVFFDSLNCPLTDVRGQLAFHWVKTAYEQSVPMNRSSAYFYFDAIATIAIEGKTLPVD